ncbi:hypothetical protein [Burkholderia savannae]|uniref:hypothetical protein n=2 Tax=Burkholderiaceae TaxID=119060 RepID=UPI0012F48BDE|nr:hypothetical protein [Burkholderia savannae]
MVPRRIPARRRAPAWSLKYRNEDAIFPVQPTAQASMIGLTVTKEINDFVRTTTGVSNSPTKNTREFESSLSVKDGDAVLIGGGTGVDAPGQALKIPRRVPASHRCCSACV